MANPIDVDQTGQCLCGGVKFHTKGTMIFNQLCHCRACGRARGMTPVHLVGVKGDFTILEGEDLIKDVQGHQTLIHTICKQCGTGLYQRPKGVDFYATFPSTFQIETSTKESFPSSLLPSHLLPKNHANYENRLHDFHDSLPKYKAFPGANAVLMTNEGEIIEGAKS
jgi:hypothetical protein